MSRISNAFLNHKAFLAFVTAGDPDLDTTEALIYAMEKAGADVIELGIPFSDPVAEGPVIQDANERALKAGCTTDKLFDLVIKVRKNTQIPIVFLTYMNPVFTYGKERFFQKCRDVGVDGIIVPDLPFEEKEEISNQCLENEIQLISMIAPTSKERITMIAKEAQGFVYCVSSMGVTGVRHEIKTNLSEMIELVKTVTTTPCAIGFGISTITQAEEMAKIADGVIVGSAIVKIVSQYGKDSVKHVEEYVKSMKDAIDKI